MFASLAASGHKSARAVVAGWLIAVHILLTASVGAVFCGAGSATEAGPDVIAADSATANQNYVDAAAEAAANAADGMGRIELEAAILDTQTGQLALGGRPAIPMLSASLSKLIVAVDIVDRRRAEGLVVDPFAIDLIRQALGPSDDLAMNELWTGFDGAGAVGRVAARLGLTGTVMPEDPSIWGEVTVTAADIARIYRHVLRMPQRDRDLIIGALAAAPAVAADGFDQDFGLLAPRSTGPIAAKQGWMCCWGTTSYLHSAGLVGDEGRFVVVLLSRQELEEDWQAGRDRLTALTNTVNEVLSAAVGVVP
ncbi:hypothetical protein [Nocardia sp. 348MFTsu5.1]|uniref:hypothetical protein n=1 Tax=Nocardia sp. 348MFTsu5.1 TaxID=1172185 RepID=UPI00036FE39A|nr:hypothetical protein [Nocardia sp. 348MFTsu5.1]